jgi:hypothetical protein
VMRASTGRGRKVELSLLISRWTKAQLPLLKSKEITTIIVVKAVAIPANIPLALSLRKNYSCSTYFFN